MIVTLHRLCPGLNLNLAQTAPSPAQREGAEVFQLGVHRGPPRANPYQRKQRGGGGRAACEMGSFVLTE